MTTCPHQTQPPGKDTGRRFCSLGLHGGRPYIGECNACISKGQNNEQFANELKARRARSHPESAEKISGCCDRADQGEHHANNSRRNNQ